MFYESDSMPSYIPLMIIVYPEYVTISRDPESILHVRSIDRIR